MLVIDPSDVVYVKSLVEASEGLASIFAESGGTLTIASSESRADELEGLLADVVAELDRDARQASWRRPEERRDESFGASQLEPARCA